MTEDHPRPASLADLFMSFTVLALQGFGGVLAVVQREMVERKRWLTQEEFIEDWAVAQVMPGPNVVNLSLMIGDRYFGLRGAMTALAGILTVPLLLVLRLAVLCRHGDGCANQSMAVLRRHVCIRAEQITASDCRLRQTKNAAQTPSRPEKNSEKRLRGRCCCQTPRINGTGTKRRGCQCTPLKGWL